MQSEVSQKEKNKYCIVTHIYGIQKNGTAKPTCKAGIEAQTQETDMDRVGEGGDGANWLKYVHYHM